MSNKAVAKKGKPKVTSRIRLFFRSVWVELKKVQWPTRRQVLVYTGIVLATIFALCLCIWIIDTILTNIMELFF